VTRRLSRADAVALMDGGPYTTSDWHWRSRSSCCGEEAPAGSTPLGDAERPAHPLHDNVATDVWPLMWTPSAAKQRADPAAKNHRRSPESE